MFPITTTYLLVSRLPNARLRVCPDSGHGFLFQWPVEYASMVASFLSDAP
jgi:pimeloyl-ACP methyl ester carboxylesterase